MCQEGRCIHNGGFFQEDERVEAGAAEDDETREEKQPGEAVLPPVRQALHRRQDLHVQRGHGPGGGTVGHRQC